jgi:hypothetical protein
MNLEPPTGFEPVTPSLQVRCSTELSYGGALFIRSLSETAVHLNRAPCYPM